MTLQAAQYSPEAMRELIKIFKHLPGSQDTRFNAYSSHPSQDLRLEQVNTLITAGNYPRKNPQKTGAFATIKARLMEKNISMHLRSRHFQLALESIDKMADSERGALPVLSFYRAEAHMGMAKYPQDAAIEKHWIETGNIKKQNQYTEQFMADTDKNAVLAEQLYKRAAMAEQSYTPALKRLGELNQWRNNTALAVQWYEQYLSANPEGSDRKSIEGKIKRLGQ